MRTLSASIVLFLAVVSMTTASAASFLEVVPADVGGEESCEVFTVYLNFPEVPVEPRCLPILPRSAEPFAAAFVADQSCAPIDIMTTTMPPEVRIRPECLPQPVKDVVQDVKDLIRP